MNQDSLKKKKAKLLYKFLKKKLCLQKYIHNILVQHENDKATKEYLETLDLIQFLIRQNSSIDWAFTWSATKEGRQYWELLHDEFEREWYSLKPFYIKKF